MRSLVKRVGENSAELHKNSADLRKNSSELRKMMGTNSAEKWKKKKKKAGAKQCGEMKNAAELHFLASLEIKIYVCLHVWNSAPSYKDLLADWVRFRGTTSEKRADKAREAARGRTQKKS